MDSRTVRSLDVQASDPARVANGIEDLYNDKLDVIVIRRAFVPEPLAAVGAKLDRDDVNPGWARPNEKMPVEDIQLLGTDTPATPTFQAPRGASLDAYLESAARHQADADGVFQPGFDVTREFQNVLGRCAGGRPVGVATNSDGRAFVPYTIRRLVDGKQIGIHHDYHYPLALYKDLAPTLDTTTLVSFVVTLGAPQAGGELFVYAAGPATPDVPKLPNGFQYDLEAIEKRYPFAKFEMEVGDLFLLASGRCLHRVGKISGPRARVTMGGFLALDKARERVVFWS
jgi:hapalindole-type alkaloid chlorinase